MSRSPSPQIASVIETGGRHLRFTNLDKVLWPQAGFTKGDMLAYYRCISAVMLPHLVDRPMVLARFPDGVEAEFWFQTQCPNPPDWVRTHPIPKAGDARATFDYLVVDDEASLLWAANLAGIEFHPLLSKTDSLERPTGVVFDLDPGPRAGMLACCRVALRLRSLLSQQGLSCYPKTTGSTGLHVHVPLNSAIDYDRAKSFARAVARQLVDEDPDLVTDRSARVGREEKVLIDWAQNNRFRSVVAPYSLRGMPLPSAATPLLWEEVELAVHGNAGESLIFLASTVLERIQRLGDPLEPVLTETQHLPPI